MGTRLLLVVLAVGCGRGCGRALPDAGAYDECAGRVGNRVEVRSLETADAAAEGCGDFSTVAVFKAEADFLAVWQAATDESPPAVDWSTEQVVCFSTWTGPTTQAVPEGFYRSTEDPNLLWLRVLDDHECWTVDCPGRPVWYLWATPRNAVEICRLGEVCDDSA